jgi:NAD(P)H-flavin reductase
MASADTAGDGFRPAIYRVARAWRELADCVSLEVHARDGQALPACLPGQFNMLYAFGVGEAAISVSRVQGDSFVHTVREVGAVSRALAALQPGATLGLRGPFGSAWPLEQARGEDLVIVAGGLGLAPLRPAIDQALRERASFRRVVILCGARSPRDLLFPAELEAWRARGDVELLVSVDHAGADWHGHVGVVPSLIGRAGLDPARSHALLCGPEIMMRFGAAALGDLGVAPQRIHLSMERNMKCGIGLCGHCQWGPDFVCREGPVLRYDRIAARLLQTEI